MIERSSFSIMLRKFNAKDQKLKRTLHWICDSPTPYNSQLFQALALENNFRLKVYYCRSELASHPWKYSLRSNYDSQRLNIISGIDWGLIKQSLLPRRKMGEHCFVIGGWNNPTALALLFISSIRKLDFQIWTDTPNISVKRPVIKGYLRKHLLKFVFARSKYVMGTGKQALEVLEKMGAPFSKLINFPYWIDISLYNKLDKKIFNKELESKPIIFISSGVLVNKRKGHNIAIRAIANAAKLGKFEFQYWLIGIGPDKQALIELSDSLGVLSCIKFLDWQENDKLVDYLNLADVFIHPSPIHEPYGVAVIEAMAAGLPILASDRTCAALDRIIPGLNGEIHRAGNVTELSDQIYGLVCGQKIERMGASALDTAREWPLSRGVDLIRKIVLEKRD